MKKIYLAFLLLSVTACSISSDKMIPMEQVANQITYDETLKSSIIVGNVNVNNSTGLIYGRAVSESEFKATLEKSFKQAGLLAKDHSTFVLEASLLELDIPLFELTFSKTATTKVQYTLRRSDTNELVMDETVTTSYTAEFSEGKNRATIATANAVRETLLICSEC